MSENRYKKSSKAPMIILIVVSVIIVAGIICAVIFLNGNTTPKDPKDLIEETTILELPTDGAQDTQPQTESIDNTEDHTHENNQPQQSSEVVVVPTINGGEQGDYFSASFSPSSAIDTFTDTNCSLKEVFGSSYSGGSITFNSDGTLSDNLSLTGASTGAYAVEGDQIVATYANDKNYIITISKWNGDVPAEIIMNIGGYDVYFN